MEIDRSGDLITVWLKRPEIETLIGKLQECLKLGNESSFIERSTGHDEVRIEFVKEMEKI